MLCKKGTSDIQESKAITHEMHKIDIYSCSWGLNANVYEMVPVRMLVSEALEMAFEKVTNTE